MPSSPVSLAQRFKQVRAQTEYLCQPLETDDFQVQSNLQTSPPKWHIAHMSWFFETFVLSHFDSRYQVFDSEFDFIFNSYYFTHGEMHPRAKRHLLTRPTLKRVWDYRQAIDEKMLELFDRVDDARWSDLEFRLTLGLHHEQQHQELLLMDIKQNFSSNPLQPVYRDDLNQCVNQPRETGWVKVGAGVVQQGHDGEGFAFDNESPRHPVISRGYRLADQLVTNRQYLEFIDDGAYHNPALWLSDGWAFIQQQQCRHPLYWREESGGWSEFTLGGRRPLRPDEPVCHISFYEADAFARWVGKRLPLEHEIEHVIASHPLNGNFADSELYHPAIAGKAAHWYGDLWTWTASPYTAYPGFKPLQGSMGEYNGKFMSNQMILKGGSCVTPAGHTRASYRNFFYPDERWAFTGIRLADD